MNRNTDPQPQKKKPRRCKKQIVFYSAILVLLVGPLLAWGATYLYFRIALAQAWAQLEKQGEPVSLDDFPPRIPTVRPDENAAVLMERVARVMPTLQPPLSNWKDTYNAARPASTLYKRVDQVEPLLAAHQPVFDAIGRALNAPHCQYRPIKLSLMKNRPFQIQHYVDYCRLLQLQAGWIAHEDNTDTGLQQMRKPIQLSEFLADDPTFFGLLIRASLQTIYINGINDILLQGHPSANELRTLATRLDTINLTTHMRRSLQLMRIEYSIQLPKYLQNTSSSSGARPWPKDYEKHILFFGYRYSGFARLHDELEAINAMTYLLRIYQREPIPPTNRPFEAWGTSLDWKFRIGPVSSICRMYQHAIAQLRLISLALRLYADRLEGKAYPDTVSEQIAKGTADWRDPFTGKAFGVVRRDGFLILYSEGKDGGVDPEEIRSYANTDSIPNASTLPTPVKQVRYLDWQGLGRSAYVLLPLLPGDEGYDAKRARLYGWPHAD